MSLVLQKMDVHTFIKDGKRLALDVPHSMAFELDPVTSDMIELCKEKERAEEDIVSALGHKYSVSTITPALHTLHQFQKSGLLLCEGQIKGEYISSIYQLSLHASNDCNLRCVYCYSENGTPGSRRRGEMTEEVAKKALDFLVSEHGRDASGYRVNFVGIGEPLLNFPLIQWVRTYCDNWEQKTGKKIHTWISTNGTVLTGEILTYFSETNQGLTISMDGPMEVHDRLRSFPNGEGSHQVIVSNIRKILNSEVYRGELKNLWVVATITGQTRSIVEVFKHLVDLGIPNVGTSLVRAARTEDYAITEANAGAIQQGYRDLVDFILEQVKANHLSYLLSMLNHIDFLGKMILRLLFHQKRGYRCDAGKGSICVDINGDLYPCSSLSAFGFKMGNVLDGDWDPACKQTFLDLHVSKKPVCKDCWARYLCGGGCYHSAQLINGSLYEPDPVRCTLIRYVIELAMEMIVEIQAHPEVSAKLHKFLQMRNRVYQMRFSA